MLQSKSSTEVDPRQPLIPSHDLVDHFRLWYWLDLCPHAQTMTAYDLDRNEFLCYALPCNQWSCRHCAVRKTRALAFRTERAKPNRLCTLTVDPKLHVSPRAAFDATRRQVPEWVKVMRSKFGEVEYLRVTEITKKGWPHYHLMIRSKYIPHAVARDHWMLLTGASIVDIRQIKKRFSCYTYLVKYLTKLHQIEWTGRHVSYSRKFFKPKDDPNFQAHSLQEREVHNCHPSHFIMDHPVGSTIHKLTPRSYRILPPGETLDTYREDCGEQKELFARGPQVEADEKPPETRRRRSHAS